MGKTTVSNIYLLSLTLAFTL